MKNEQIVRNKLWASWDVAQKHNGVANVYGWGLTFYDSLVNPGNVCQFLCYVRNHRLPQPSDEGRYPPIRDESAPQHFTADEALTDEEPERLKAFGRDAFVTEFRAIVTSDVDFRQALFLGAFEALNELKDMGPTRIWTEGDTRGEGKMWWPGSGEQRCKLESVGVFTEYRKEDWHTVIAAEDKWQLLPETVEPFADWGVTHIFVLDDKPKNLDDAKGIIDDILKQLGRQEQVKVILMAVGEGHRGLQNFRLRGCKIDPGSKGGVKWDDQVVVDGQTTTPRKHYNAVENIAEAPDKVREILEKENDPKPAFILDWDSVFSDDVARQALQQAAVLEWLEKHVVPSAPETLYWRCGRGTPSKNRPNTVLFAAHDDGSGGFYTLLKLAKAMWDTVRNAGKNPQKELMLLFVNSSASNGPTDVAQAFGSSGIYLRTDNLIRLPKDPSVGGVRPDGLLSVVQKVAGRMDSWAATIPWQNAIRPNGTRINGWVDIDLAISMGVPWAHREAWRVGTHSIEVGDMCWSLVLGGSLEMANRSTSFARNVLARVAKCELLATEAWLLPFATPIEYVEHFASGGVPVNWLPGVFLERPGVQEWQDTKNLRVAFTTAARGRKIVGLYAGRTRVWDGVMDMLADRDGSTEYAVFGVRNDEIQLLEKTGGRVNPRVDTVVFVAASNLFLSRGGITALDCIAAHTPVAVTEEPFHWLSARQREALERAGLCLPIPLQGLQQNPTALIEELLARSDELMDVQARTYGIQSGSEWHLAQYLLKRLGVI